VGRPLHHRLTHLDRCDHGGDQRNQVQGAEDRIQQFNGRGEIEQQGEYGEQDELYVGPRLCPGTPAGIRVVFAGKRTQQNKIQPEHQELAGIQQYLQPRRDGEPAPEVQLILDGPEQFDAVEPGNQVHQDVHKDARAKPQAEVVPLLVSGHSANDIKQHKHRSDGENAVRESAMESVRIGFGQGGVGDCQVV
jgi:hypothetical protein